jgi:hypothetical protein
VSNSLNYKTQYYFILVILCLLLSNLAIANPLHIKQKLKVLSQKKTWSNLLHYSNHKSDIKSKSFFLSKEGMFNLESEIVSNYHSFFIKKNIKKICRFRARYLWLSKQLKYTTTLLSKCKHYKNWTKNKSIKSVSLIFASGYLDNPASFFGHPMLRFNFTNKDALGLLNIGINYGALTPASPHPIKYVIKGLLGGYSASFSEAKFFHTVATYADNELRDLWEYKLRLTPWEKELLISHVWELLGVKFPYYFISDNCALRMAKVLELIINKKLMNSFSPAAVPHDLLNRLYKTGKVSQINYIPSTQSEMSNYYNHLTEYEKNIFKRSISTPKKIKALLKNLNNKQKIHILDSLIKYYTFVNTKSPSSKSKKNRRNILLLRSQIEIKSHSFFTATPPKGLHQGQPPAALKIGLGKLQQNSFMFFGVRGAYYDLVSPVLGHNLNSELIMGQVYANIYANKLHLEDLTLLSIKSLNPSNTGLPLDDALAWNIKASFRSAFNNSKKILLDLAPGIGKSYKSKDHSLFYIFIDSLITSEKRIRGINLGPKAGFVINSSKLLRSKLELAQYHNIHKQRKTNTVSLETRIINKKYHDYQINIKSWQEYTQYSIMSNFYF